MYGIGFICGMIFVWAFGIAHDVITNFYIEAKMRKDLRKEMQDLEKKK
jgi:hypothetical protein